MSKMPDFFGRIAAIPALLLLTGASGYSPIPYGYRVIPEPVPVGETERVFRPGDTIISARIRRAGRVATLIQRATFSAGSVGADFPAGTVLQSVRMAGDAAPNLAGGRALYCAAPQPIALGPRGRYDKRVRFCLFERDRNPGFDAAVLVGARKPNDQTVASIAPVLYQAVEPRQPVGEVRLRYVKSSPLGMYLRIDLIDGGRVVPFDALFSSGSFPEAIAAPQWMEIDQQLPKEIQEIGARIQLLERDKKTGVLRARIVSPIPPIELRPTVGDQQILIEGPAR